VPIAAYAVCNGNKLNITGLVADNKGRRFFKSSLEGTPKEAEDLGKRLAEILLEKGAKEVLEEIYAKGG
jgi:hydroxymethylbilane synthase